jgi:rhodanese-related sulfurtransferase
MKKVFLLSICLTIFILNSFPQNKSQNCYHNINSDDFNLLIETKELILIDVRLAKEFRKERLFHARLAASSQTLIPILKNLDKNIFVLVYCDEGERSKTASQIICNELGFKNVYNLKGGIVNWKKRGYSVNYSRITNKQN